MKNDNEIVESLIAGGIIGAGLGALLFENTDEGSMLGAIAGAALLATFKANQEADKTNITMYIEEDGYLYQTSKGNQRKQVRKLEKPTITLQEHFKLL